MRAELLRLTGMLEVQYHIGQDFFWLRFESVLVNLDTIFAAVAAAGKKMGRAYIPEVMASRNGRL